MEEDIKNEIISKAGFPLYVDYWDKYLSKLTGDKVKEVFKIVFHFNKTYEVLASNDLAVDMVVTTIIDNIKRDAVKRIKQSKASRKNGKLGGRPSNDKIAKSRIKKNTNVATNDNTIVTTNVNQELADGLKFILEEKHKRKIKATNWKEDIRKLIENDLKPRSNAIDDVKKAIQAVSDHYGKEYFPVIQSAGSLKYKFSSIENYLARNSKKDLSYFDLKNINLEE